MHTDGRQSMLLSAIVGHRVDLAEYLLHRGVSPNEQIKLYDPSHTTNKTVSVWIAFIGILVCAPLSRFSKASEANFKTLLSILRRFLQTGAVSSDVFITLGAVGFSDGYMTCIGTHAISFPDFIEQVDPDNREEWNNLFTACEKKGSPTPIKENAISLQRMSAEDCVSSHGTA